MNGEPFWRALTPVEIAVLAAGAVALVGMILALLTPRGRAAFALLGLRVADALVSWLERLLGPAQREARAVQRERALRAREEWVG